MFPELRLYLEEAFNLAGEGANHVVTRYRDPKCNLRTQLLRFIGRAGVAPWGRLFHNLRSSRQTELTEQYPVHVVAHWLGNSPRTSAQHYLQVRDSDYERAAKSGADRGGQRRTGRIRRKPWKFRGGTHCFQRYGRFT